MPIDTVLNSLLISSRVSWTQTLAETYNSSLYGTDIQTFGGSQTVTIGSSNYGEVDVIQRDVVTLSASGTRSWTDLSLGSDNDNVFGDECAIETFKLMYVRNRTSDTGLSGEPTLKIEGDAFETLFDLGSGAYTYVHAEGHLLRWHPVGVAIGTDGLTITNTSSNLPVTFEFVLGGFQP